MGHKFILVHSIFKRFALLTDHHGDMSDETAVIYGDGAVSASPILVFQKCPNKLNNFDVLILLAKMALVKR